MSSGRLVADSGSATITFHDPCYLGRHNDVYDAPRNVLNVLSNQVVELPRNRENSFCCGAGGAQFWKEEEPGEERISDNRYREVKETLKDADEKVLAVGCPFCKSMLDARRVRADDSIEIKDVAVLLLEGVERRAGKLPEHASPALSTLDGVELVDHCASRSSGDDAACLPMPSPLQPHRHMRTRQKP